MLGITLDKLWYGQHPLSLLLLPLSWLFCLLVRLRRLLYQSGLKASHRMSGVPVVVVGNITVGGTGKTPMVLWLANFLYHQGFKPGIVSRGYGSRVKRDAVMLVRPDSDTLAAGDEPVLLAQRSGCPVAIAPCRIKALELLVREHSCDMIISDDGLQHYAMQRDVEILMLDATRGYGNRRCLPAGPLREPLSRLRHVDMIVNKDGDAGNVFRMHYDLPMLHRLGKPEQEEPLFAWRGREVHALAGIANPQHFFQRLQEAGLKLHIHCFPDHHGFTPADIMFNDNLPVLMTEKDAVKCRTFATQQHWYAPIEARLPEAFAKRLLNLLKQRTGHGQEAA